MSIEDLPITTTNAMSADQFQARTGHAPRDDDLDRVNCAFAGQLGHKRCGFCDEHNGPRYACRCAAPKPKGGAP